MDAIKINVFLLLGKNFKKKSCSALKSSAFPLQRHLCGLFCHKTPLHTLILFSAFTDIVSTLYILRYLKLL